VFVLRHDSSRLYDHLVDRGWSLIGLSMVAGAAALLTTLRPRLLRPGLVRPLGAVAVGAVLVGWGVAQYPYLLGTHLSIHQAAAPPATMSALTVVSVAALVTIGPSLLWLFLLTHRGSLVAGHD
jgi:cytochrome d ubiquinol oxidase subunit II